MERAEEGASSAIEQILPRLHSGKVRDVFAVGDDHLLLMTSDRLSAFDRILTSIPGKGQALDAITWFWIDKLKGIIPHAYVERLAPNASLARRAEMLPVEFVVRAYLCGSGWRDYRATGSVSGIALPEGLREFDRLPQPILTPSTKSAVGVHDEAVSKEELIKREVISKELFDVASAHALKLFEAGQRISRERGLLLVDTKYEFGVVKDKLLLSDEVHTPDSSRFWLVSNFDERLAVGEPPEMMDKEVIRRWLMEQGYMGDGSAPEFGGAFIAQCVKLYQGVAKMFVPDFETQPVDEGKLLKRLGEL